MSIEEKISSVTNMLKVISPELKQHLIVEDNFACLEASSGLRRLTFYFEPNKVTYVKAHMDKLEDEEEFLPSIENIFGAYKWLNEGKLK